ncbi:MAG: Wzz/FepE/Etk N-terminal domain-containing protein [bacterium]
MEENQKRRIEEDEIDLVEVAKTIWRNRKTIYKTVAVFFVIGILVAVLSPVEYESETILLPEVQEEGISAGMAGGLLKQFGGLAGLAGLGSAEMGVMSPQLYPQILKSTPFLLHVMEQPVYFANEDTTVTVYQYFDEVKSPSFFGLVAEYTIGLPGKIKKALSKKEEEVMVKNEDGKIKLTEKQKEIAEGLIDRIEVELDDEMGTVEIKAKMPDAEAAASIAEIAKNYLTDYVTDYRTNKASEDMQFIQDRHEEAKIRFENAQSRLAYFRDRNIMLSTARARSEEERLNNEYQLAFNVYNGLAEQLEQSKIAVQEKMPVFEVLEPVKVPIEKSEPRRGMVVIIFLVIGLILSFLYFYIHKLIKKIQSNFSLEV